MTHAPVKKNVPGTFSACKVARISGIASAFAPASNVSATTCWSVGNRTTSLPASAATTLGSGIAVVVNAGGAVVTVGGAGLAAGLDTDGDVGDDGAAEAGCEIGAGSGWDVGRTLRTIDEADSCGVPLDP